MEDKINNTMDDNTLDLMLKRSAAEHQPHLPSAQTIWWRAQIVARQKQRERVERPLLAMFWVAAATCLCLCLIAFTPIKESLQVLSIPLSSSFTTVILAIAAVGALIFFFRAPLQTNSNHT